MPLQGQPFQAQETSSLLNVETFSVGIFLQRDTTNIYLEYFFTL